MTQTEFSAPPVQSAAVQSVYDGMTAHHRAAALALRSVIFEIAQDDPRIGRVEETLKWGQPAYLTHAPKSGTTLRIAEVKVSGKAGALGLYVPCSTTLISDFGAEFGGAYTRDGTRGIIFAAPEFGQGNGPDDAPGSGAAVPDAIARFIHKALVYHL